MTDTTNCGLPEGTIHAHNHRCYDAGRLDGRAELAGLLTQQTLRQLARELTAARALVGVDTLSPSERFEVGDALNVAEVAIRDALAVVTR